MKKILFLIAIAMTMIFLCTNVSYANLSETSCANDFSGKKSLYNKSADSANSTSNTASCASSCYAVNSGNDCGNVVYEIDEFPGSAHHSNLGGNGSGTGCQYYGYSAPHVLGVGSGSSYTLCTEYTASSDEASYITYLNAGSSSCIDRSISLYKASTCGTPYGVNIEQPNGSLPGRARGLTVGESYVVCHTYTENGCSSNSSSNIYEVCMSISEASYCSSHVSPAPIETCSGEDFQIPLGNNCSVDSDLGVPNGTPGYAAFFYSTDGGNTYTNFPTNSIAEDIATSSNYKFYDESNSSNGAGCSPINMRGIVNTGCEPLVIPVGIVSIDVSSVGSLFPIQVLYDCPIIETTITVYPQFTSQVTGSSIQLIAEDGTICETYSTTPTPTTPTTPTFFGNATFSANISSILHGGIVLNGNLSTNGTLSGPLGQTLIPNNPTTGGNTGIPDDIPCVTPSGLLAPDTNGNTLLAHTVETNEAGQLVFTYELPVQKAAVYPNPATNQLFFTTTQTETYTVRIYDTVGKQVYVGQTTDDSPININHLSAGLYTYALENAQQDILHHGKWVKQ